MVIGSGSFACEGTQGMSRCRLSRRSRGSGRSGGSRRSGRHTAGSGLSAEGYIFQDPSKGSDPIVVQVQPVVQVPGANGCVVGDVDIQ